MSRRRFIFFVCRAQATLEPLLLQGGLLAPRKSFNCHNVFQCRIYPIISMNLTFKHYFDIFEKYLIYAKNLPVRSPDQQKTALNANHWLELCRTLYTAALDHRISVYRQYRKILSGGYLANQLPSMKAVITELNKAAEAGRTVTIVPPP